ncbi:MAG TPA: SDR family oxidoreductase [Myxococcaceae bacterium]|nr:SDR family oxidoreductase [Myxococcaceae bacterium]
MGRTALVTGASSGLGEDFARLFAGDGVDLVLVARRRERLEALAAELRQRNVSVHVISADLAVPEEVERVIRQVQGQGLEVEFLVNNAGLGNVGAFSESTLSSQMTMVDVNVRALVRLTHAFLPGMLSRRRGRVLNIGSTAGLQPGPYGAVYYATKAFVNSFTEALSHELKGTGVTATVSLPGATATEFASVAGSGQTRLFRSGVMSSTEVARAAYRAMLRGTPFVVHGWRNKVLGFSVRLGPRSVVRSVAAAMNKSGRPPA